MLGNGFVYSTAGRLITSLPLRRLETFRGEMENGDVIEGDNSSKQ